MPENAPTPDLVSTTTPSSDDVSTPSVNRTEFALRTIAAVVGSLAFLAYVLFGTVEARVWGDGRLTFDDRSILGMWQDMRHALPAMPNPGLMSSLFTLSLIVMVIGTVIGLWLFLGGDEDELDAWRDRTKHRDSSPSNHA